MPATILIKEAAVAIQEKAASAIPDFKNLDTGKGSFFSSKNELPSLKNEIPEFSKKETLADFSEAKELSPLKHGMPEFTDKGIRADFSGVKELTQTNKEIPVFHDVESAAIDTNNQNAQSQVDHSKATKDSPAQASTVSQGGEVSLHKNEVNVKDVAYSNNDVNPQNYLPQKDSSENLKNAIDSVSDKLGLTEEEKQQIKNESGWSDSIIDAINSMKEYEIYANADLKEVDINDKKCLVRSDIDWDQKDSMGRTNKERAEAGLSPINKAGDTIELHHIGQKSDGCLAELTSDEHRSKENYSVLHDANKESEIDRNLFNNERSEHWQERVKQGGLYA